MAILKVYKYPHAVLRQPCLPVEAFDETLKQIVADMTETMYSFGGAVGLAAPQVGVTQRIIVIDTAAKTTRDRQMILINPVIIKSSRNKQVREGCLSFPEYLANVKRATKLTVQAYDASGTPQTFDVEGLEAVAVQHEIDHLDGVLMIDRINSLKTDWIRRHQTAPIQETPASI
ncbi:MAG: peptide deformylase [Vampirovibrionales bacterium]|nr:peptide deformylase [Vampirovibrionales bacterium]